MADNLLPCDCAMRGQISEECIKKVLRLMKLGVIFFFFLKPKPH